MADPLPRTQNRWSVPVEREAVQPALDAARRGDQDRNGTRSHGCTQGELLNEAWRYGARTPSMEERDRARGW